MKTSQTTYRLSARLLHWTMAAMILAMLFIGVGATATVSGKHQWLLAVHRPLGIAILMLAIVRLALRLRNPPPTLPPTLSKMQRIAAQGSHWLLYLLMTALPLMGWAMLSAAGDPMTLSDNLSLPPILPANALLYAWLRTLHGVLAYLLFFALLVHMGAALHHALIRRDGVMRSMLGRESGSCPNENASPRI